MKSVVETLLPQTQQLQNAATDRSNVASPNSSPTVSVKNYSVRMISSLWHCICLFFSSAETLCA